MEDFSDGYDAAMDDIFNPETGWMWDVLSEAVRDVSPHQVEGANQLSDNLVERIMREIEAQTPEVKYA
jgi:hypothetical protein